MKPYSGSPTNQHAPPTLRKIHMDTRVVIWLQNPDLKSALTLNSRALWPPAPERFGIQHYRLEQQYLSLIFPANLVLIRSTFQTKQIEPSFLSRTKATRAPTSNIEKFKMASRNLRNSGRKTRSGTSISGPNYEALLVTQLESPRPKKKHKPKTTKEEDAYDPIEEFS